jgi:cell division cycle 14
LGQLYRFCTKLNQKLKSKQFANHVICFCSNKTPAKRANAMFLVCAWQMLYLNRTPEEAMLGFQAKDPDSMDVVLPASANSSAPPSVIEGNPVLVPVPPFHDASPCACTFDLTILDCLKGLEKARTYGFFDFERFDADEYEHYEQVEVRDVAGFCCLL